MLIKLNLSFVIRVSYRDRGVESYNLGSKSGFEKFRQPNPVNRHIKMVEIYQKRVIHALIIKNKNEYEFS